MYEKDTRNKAFDTQKHQMGMQDMQTPDALFPKRKLTFIEREFGEFYVGAAPVLACKTR